MASLQPRYVRKCGNMFKRNKARRCSWRIMEKKKWVYCAMGSQNILNNSPFANHPPYYMCLYSRNFFSSTTICSTSWKEFLRFPCLRTETRKSWNWNFVKIEIDENYSDLRGSLKTNIVFL